MQLIIDPQRLPEPKYSHKRTTRPLLPAATIIIRKQCNQCQHLMEVSARFCGHCGLQLMF